MLLCFCLHFHALTPLCCYFVIFLWWQRGRITHNFFTGKTSLQRGRITHILLFILDRNVNVMMVEWQVNEWWVCWLNDWNDRVIYFRGSIAPTCPHTDVYLLQIILVAGGAYVWHMYFLIIFDYVFPCVVIIKKGGDCWCLWCGTHHSIPYFLWCQHRIWWVYSSVSG